MDKQKKIEEIAKDLKQIKFNMQGCFIPQYVGVHEDITARDLYELGYRKIPENAVVIPKEVSFYDNLEERIRTFNLDGNKVDFTDEQIMALTQILHFKEKQEKEIRKETAEMFAERLKELIAYRNCNDGYDWEDVQVDGQIFVECVDEIAKEITEGE